MLIKQIISWCELFAHCEDICKAPALKEKTAESTLMRLFSGKSLVPMPAKPLKDLKKTKALEESNVFEYTKKEVCRKNCLLTNQ